MRIKLINLLDTATVRARMVEIDRIDSLSTDWVGLCELVDGLLGDVGEEVEEAKTVCLGVRRRL